MKAIFYWLTYNLLINSIQLNQFSKLDFHDPEGWFVELKKLELETANYKMAPRVRALRTNKLKMCKESREAALFCHGMSCVLGRKVYFTLEESSDYDCVALWQENGFNKYCPVQLKELVSEKL